MLKFNLNADKYLLYVYFFHNNLQYNTHTSDNYCIYLKNRMIERKKKTTVEQDEVLLK